MLAASQSTNLSSSTTTTSASPLLSLRRFEHLRGAYIGPICNVAHSHHWRTHAGQWPCQCICTFDSKPPSFTTCSTSTGDLTHSTDGPFTRLADTSLGATLSHQFAAKCC